MKNKIDFMALVTVTHANPNGDPLADNRPRTNYQGLGEISNMCIKRKIRNRMQDMGHPIFVQSDDRRVDEYDSLKSRFDALLKSLKLDKAHNSDKEKAMVNEWLDVRSFGAVAAFGKSNKQKDDNSDEQDKGTSIGIRGPVTIQDAYSINNVVIATDQITKSVNSNSKDGKSSDTMGSKQTVEFGLYVIKGSINARLAEKTGFSDEDAEVIKECLKTLFENDASSARPEGSMEVKKVFWWVHEGMDGCIPTAAVHRSVNIALNDNVVTPTKWEDYTITTAPLPNGISATIYSPCEL